MRKLIIATAILALTNVARAELLWDGFVQVPGWQDQQSYWVCPPGSYLVSKGGTLADLACWEGRMLPKQVATAKKMDLQAALDLHFKAPTGYRAQAVGPLPKHRHGHSGPDKTAFYLAYKLVRAN